MRYQASTSTTYSSGTSSGGGQVARCTWPCSEQMANFSPSSASSTSATRSSAINSDQVVPRCAIPVEERHHQLLLLICNVEHKIFLPLWCLTCASLCRVIIFLGRSSGGGGRRGVGGEERSCFFITLVLDSLNSLFLNSKQPLPKSSEFLRTFRKVHTRGVEVIESSTNKQHIPSYRSFSQDCFTSLLNAL